jgi:hypothetical protein
MHIIYVINQHHCDKIKDYPHVDHQIKKYFYFQYIKTCLWLVLVFFCDKEQKLFTLPCLDPYILWYAMCVLIEIIQV